MKEEQPRYIVHSPSSKSSGWAVEDRWERKRIAGIWRPGPGSRSAQTIAERLAGWLNTVNESAGAS